jgi:hypothetical protein
VQLQIREADSRHIYMATRPLVRDMSEILLNRFKTHSVAALQVHPASSPRSREGALFGKHISFEHHNIARTKASSSSPRLVSSEPSNSLQSVRQGVDIVWGLRSLCAPLNEDRVILKFLVWFRQREYLRLQLRLHLKGGR